MNIHKLNGARALEAFHLSPCASPYATQWVPGMYGQWAIVEPKAVLPGAQAATTNPAWLEASHQLHVADDLAICIEPVSIHH